MTSLRITKPSCHHTCDKCVSPGTSNMSLDVSQGGSSRVSDINIDGQSYVNTPSPSSIGSTCTHDRSSNLRDDYHPQIFSNRRYRHDKLFHRTHSLNRQYIMTMTNILFEMQKEIYKLKRRTKHVEHLLAKKIQTGHPVLPTPRSSTDVIFTGCAKNRNSTSTALEESENVPNIEVKETTMVSSQPSDEVHTNKEIPIVVPVEHEGEKLEETVPSPPPPKPKIKYCVGCEHEFSNRSAYLRHIRKIHHDKVPTTSRLNRSSDVDRSPIGTNALTTDASAFYFEVSNESDGEPVQVLVNQWDIGEGRLRPRPAPKLSNELTNKAKCDVCNKFFRAEYIKKHQRRCHRASQSSVSSDINSTPNPIQSNITEIFEDIQATPTESPTDPLSSITITAMDTDDVSVEFRKESLQPIVIAVTCLERYQSDIVEEFVRKFRSRVSQATTIDSHTTHLITNDDKVGSRSPLSMKLIEAIAHHCFCVSYRWIIDCLKYDRIIDESTYEIEGDDADYQHSNGGPKRSRLTERRHSLFEKVCFLIKCTENNDIKLTNNRLQSLIMSCGGRIITCVTQDLLDENTVIVLCDRLFVSERRHNYDQCRSLGIEFVSSDWVLGSIIDYNLKPFAVFEETPL